MLRKASYTVCIHRRTSHGLQIILHVYYEAESFTRAKVLLLLRQGIRFVRYIYLFPFVCKHECSCDNIYSLSPGFSMEGQAPFSDSSLLLSADASAEHVQ